MSTYIPVSTWSIIQRLHREGLIVPLPGDGAFLTDVHRRVEGELESLRSDLAQAYGIHPDLSVRWEAFFNACVRFASMTYESTWRALYGDAFLRDMCWAIFGRQLKVELCRSPSFRRRVLLVGGQGSGRPGIGDALRRLMVECLVRTLGVGDSTQDSRSAKLSNGHAAVETELFGGQRRGAEATHRGLLDQCAGSVLFVDGLLATPDDVQRRLLDRLEASGSGLTHDSTSLPGDFHLISGASISDLVALGGQDSLGQSLFQSACRDGRLEIPNLRDVLNGGSDWSTVFSLLFGQVARRYCGGGRPSLHRYRYEAPSLEETPLASDVIRTEHSNFLTWMLDVRRVESISERVRTHFEDYHWPGNLREFEALLHRLIECQITADLSLDEISHVCAQFRMRAPASVDEPRPSSWLTQFHSDLSPLPLNQSTLPEVINRVEARYLEAAARKAARMRYPKNARLQDVARLLGIPRQTATRKWQQHDLPHSLLTTDS